jgi:hypothetical protein
VSRWQPRRGTVTPDELDQFAEHWPDATRLERAFLLAPTVEIAKALITAERVPLDRLDGEWVARFGLRRVTRDDRADLDDFNVVPHLPAPSSTPAR